MVTTIDKFGRIIIPKKFRKNLGISSETTLNISEDGSRIVIEPIQEKEPLIDKNGILVFTGKIENKNLDFLNEDRNSRIRKLLTSKE